MTLPNVMLYFLVINMNIICYPNENILSLIIPTIKVVNIDNLAKNTVPYGVPYKIIQNSDIPQDRQFRDAWSLDFSNPDGFGDAK
jgi:hypothetical protein